jgi:hypothetical protein
MNGIYKGFTTPLKDQTYKLWALKKENRCKVKAWNTYYPK